MIEWQIRTRMEIKIKGLSFNLIYDIKCLNEEKQKELMTTITDIGFANKTPIQMVIAIEEKIKELTGEE